MSWNTVFKTTILQQTCQHWCLIETVINYRSGHWSLSKQFVYIGTLSNLKLEITCTFEPSWSMLRPDSQMGRNCTWTNLNIFWILQLTATGDQVILILVHHRDRFSGQHPMPVYIVHNILWQKKAPEPGRGNKNIIPWAYGLPHKLFQCCCFYICSLLNCEFLVPEFLYSMFLVTVIMENEKTFPKQFPIGTNENERNI